MLLETRTPGSRGIIVRSLSEIDIMGVCLTWRQRLSPALALGRFAQRRRLHRFYEFVYCTGDFPLSQDVLVGLMNPLQRTLFCCNSHRIRVADTGAVLLGRDHCRPLPSWMQHLYLSILLRLCRYHTLLTAWMPCRSTVLFSQQFLTVSCRSSQLSKHDSSSSA